MPPSWERLYEVAAAQGGYFSTRQAAVAGFSPQLLAKHLHNRRIARTRRAVYRLRQHPAGPHEDLVSAWLWSERAGVVSHETALWVLGLTERRPALIHLTLPRSWRRRRLRVPAGVVLHHADLRDRDRTRVGAVPTTTAARTRRDCRQSGVTPAAPATYLCLGCAETVLDRMSAAEAAKHLAEYRAFTRRLRRRGQLLACNRLLPPHTAVTVRVRRGRVSVTDGPFAETKELVGGYFVIRARSRAEAIRLAAQIPGARLGCVEVRPIADDPATLRALGLPAARATR
jgi:hypothetical protein